MKGHRGPFVVFVLVVIAFIAYAVWTVATCAEWGPPRTEWRTESCGDGCWSTRSYEVRECVRRKE